MSAGGFQMPTAPGYDGGQYPPPGPGQGYPPPQPGYGQPYPPVDQQPGAMMQPLMTQARTSACSLPAPTSCPR